VYTFHCSTEGCQATLVSSHEHPSCHNPRDRWVLNAEIKLDESDGGGTMRINLCPDCAAHFLNLDEDFFRGLERTESLISGNRPAHLSNIIEN
jgi:hypothetical protein